MSGLPRSGTSMMMRMLEAGGLTVMTDGERAADIDNPKGYYEYERVKDLEKETDKTYVREARGKALKVISFLLQGPARRQRLPRRSSCAAHLDEVLASQDKMLDRLGSEDRRGRPRGDEGGVPQRHRARRASSCRKRPNMELLEVHYDEAVGDPAAAARAVNAFLGGRLDEAAMRAAVDEELYRNRS